MANENLDFDIQPTDDGRAYTQNMFTKVLGDKYARRFQEVYYASLEDRDEKMMDLYDEAKADENLTDEQKRIITGCYLGYKEAIGSKNISTPIIAYVATKKPVISKYIKNNSRVKRIVADLYDLIQYGGFEMEISHIPTQIKVFMAQFAGKLINDQDDFPLEAIIIAAFSRFARACGPTSYANKWYILYFFRNISMLAYLPPRMLKEDPDLLPKIRNIVKSLNIIQLLEFKRAGIIGAKEDDETIEEKKKVDEHFNQMALSASSEKDALSIEVNRELANLSIDLGGKFLEKSAAEGEKVKVEVPETVDQMTGADVEPDPNTPDLTNPGWIAQAQKEGVQVNEVEI